MRLLIVHSKFSDGSFAKLLSYSRPLTEGEFQKLKVYSSNDSKSIFADYVHRPEDATICEIDDLDELEETLEQYSKQSTWSGLIGFWEKSWGGLINFWKAPLNCDGYIILNIN